MTKYNWQIKLAVSLILVSIFLHVIQYLIYGNFTDIIKLFLSALAFLPLQVLLVGIIFQKTLDDREKRNRIRKIYMLIGAFFSDTGTDVLRFFAKYDADSSIIKNELLVKSDWTQSDFRNTAKNLGEHEFKVQIKDMDLVSFKIMMKLQKETMVKLLENPILVEHETFSELLLAVFHVEEELAGRKDVENLSKPDSAHIALDMQRAYRLMFYEWLFYMEHLRSQYPYLFSFAMRVNPFDPDATVEIR